MFKNEKISKETPGVYHAMGTTAETVAKRYNVTREAQDEYALSSQLRCADAQDQGLFNDEIVPMNTVMKIVNKETGEESQEETVVNSITNGLMAVFKDNPKILKELEQHIHNVR